MTDAEIFKQAQAHSWPHCAFSASGQIRKVGLLLDEHVLIGEVVEAFHTLSFFVIDAAWDLMRWAEASVAHYNDSLPPHLLAHKLIRAIDFGIGRMHALALCPISAGSLSFRCHECGLELEGRANSNFFLPYHFFAPHSKDDQERLIQPCMAPIAFGIAS